MKKQFAYWVVVLLTAVAQGAPVFPLPPFTVYGKVRDWNGRALLSSDEAVVIVKTTNGTELARCNVTSGIYPDLTYRLTIPLASSPTAGRGEVGQALQFEVTYDGVTHTVTPSQAVPIGNPATALGCTLMLGTFNQGGPIPDEYLEQLLSYYEAAGHTNGLAGISATDDFDGDGFSNYQEFLAGTIPVEGNDYLRVLDFTIEGTNAPALRFLAAPGRMYAIPTTARIESNYWDWVYFSTSTNTPPAQDTYTSEDDAFITLYLMPTTNTAFHGLEVR